MTHYSIDGIEISLEELTAAGTRRWGGERRFGVHNCEWSAELVVRSGFRAPLVPVEELLPVFLGGNREKFDGDLPRIRPLLCAAIAAPGATVIVRTTDGA